MGVDVAKFAQVFGSWVVVAAVWIVMEEAEK